LNILFEKYKIIKANLTFDYKGYPLQNVLAVDIIALVYKKNKFNFRCLVNLFSSRNIAFSKNEKSLFSIGNYNRADYYELLSYVRNNTTSELLDLSKVNKCKNINLKNILLASYIVFAKGQGLSFFDKISLISTMVYSLNVIDFLETQESGDITFFCSFCSNLNDEAILDYYFQKRNVTTYTLQHGLWFIFDVPPIDVIAYENLIADRLLCWGQYTKDQFINYGIDETRLQVSGYPKPTNALTVRKRIHKKNRILVLFARSLFDKNNLALIELLASSDLDADFEFKLHPSLAESKYKVLADKNNFSMSPAGTIKSLLATERYDCSISYNSTAYYDSYINNCISLRYKDADADNAIDILDDGFNSSKELLEKLALVQQGQEQQSIWDEVASRLNYILGYGVNEYARIQSINKG
jgi:hypothetical protein